MRPYTHPKDIGLKFARTIGRRRVKSAEPRPDKTPEEVIHDQIESYAELTGLPYLSLRSRYYQWLVFQRDVKREPIAGEIIDAIKDMPDLIIFAPSKDGESLALPIEIKREGGRPRQGQRLLAMAIGGTIEKGLSACREAIARFLLRAHQ